MIKLNIGCGINTVQNYENLDNSPSLIIKNNIFLRFCADLLSRVMMKSIYVDIPREVKYCNVKKKLPYEDGCVDVIYSSHMLEHLSRDGAEFFLCEAFRVLKFGGILRLALPDLCKKAIKYLDMLKHVKNGTIKAAACDEFMESMHLCSRSGLNFLNLRQLLVFFMQRETHNWMYDAPSLKIILKQIGFNEVNEKMYGESFLEDIDRLDIGERKDESFYIEAIK